MKLNFTLMGAVIALVFWASSVRAADQAPVDYKMKIAPNKGPPVALQCSPDTHNRFGPVSINMPISIIGLRVGTSPTQPTTVSLSIFPLRLDLTLKCDPTGRDPISCSTPLRGTVTKRPELVRVKFRGRVWASMLVWITGSFTKDGADLKILMGDMGGKIATTGKKGACWLNYHVVARNRSLAPLRYSQH